MFHDRALFLVNGLKKSLVRLNVTEEIRAWNTPQPLETRMRLKVFEIDSIGIGTIADQNMCVL